MPGTTKAGKPPAKEPKAKETATREEFGYAADAVEVQLRRAYPAALEKAEVADAVGLNASEIRAGLEILEDEGKLRELPEPEGGYVYAMPGEEREEGGDPLERGEPKPEPEEEEPAAAPIPRPGGPFYRVVLEVVGEIGAARGENRDASAASDADAFAKFVAAKLADSGVPVGVEIARLEAFDAPREVPLS